MIEKLSRGWKLLTRIKVWEGRNADKKVDFCLIIVINM